MGHWPTDDGLGESPRVEGMGTGILELRAENARLRKALRLIEWGGSLEWCDVCKSNEAAGHASDCEIRAVLSNGDLPGDGQ